MLIFIASTQAVNETNVLYLLAGLLGVAFGMFLRRRSPGQPPTPSNRFRILHRRGREAQTDKPKTRSRDNRL